MRYYYLIIYNYMSYVAVDNYVIHKIKRRSLKVVGAGLCETLHLLNITQYEIDVCNEIIGWSLKVVWTDKQCRNLPFIVYLTPPINY